MSSGTGRTTIKLYRDGDEIETLSVPGTMSVADLKKLKDRVVASGVADEVHINGAPATASQLESIVADLNASGMAIRIDGAPVEDEGAPIADGSLVTAAREQKGGRR